MNDLRNIYEILFAGLTDVPILLQLMRRMLLLHAYCEFARALDFVILLEMPALELVIWLHELLLVQGDWVSVVSCTSN